MKTVEWNDQNLNYWRINKEEAKKLYEEFHDLMDKYGVADSALVIVKVIGDDRVNALTMTRGREEMTTILNVAEEMENRDDVLTNNEIDKEEIEQNNFLNNLLK